MSFGGFWKGVRVPRGVVVEESSDMEFAVRFPGGDRERLRLRYGMSDPREPVVFDYYITGRGWRRGFKEHSSKLARFLTEILADAAAQRRTHGRTGRTRA